MSLYSGVDPAEACADCILEKCNDLLYFGVRQLQNFGNARYAKRASTKIVFLLALPDCPHQVPDKRHRFGF